MKRFVVGCSIIVGLWFCLNCQSADFDGDGTNDIGIFRKDSGLWAIRGITRVYFGSSTDQTMPGDYNGNGTVDIAVYRPANGLWAVRSTTRVYFGSSSDEPIVGINATRSSPWISC